MCDKIVEALKAKILDENTHKIGILMHPTPDPDCIASAYAMSRLINKIRPEVATAMIYDGELSHSQNKTLVNVLSISLTHASEIEDIAEFADTFIAVDTVTERSAIGNNKDLSCFLCIDHHRVTTKRSEHLDIRTIGSTATIVWDYYNKLGIELEENNDDDQVIATALSVGIKTDTNDLTSDNTADIDWKASQELIRLVNRKDLQDIVSYPIPPYYFELRSYLDNPENTKSDKSVFVGGVGCITNSKRDALPMMAEERCRVEGIETAFVFAIVGDNIEVSVRSVGLSVDVNAVCQKLFGKQYAGGKMGAGAAKIPLGFLSFSTSSPEDVREKMWEAVKIFIIEKIFHVMGGNE